MRIKSFEIEGLMGAPQPVSSTTNDNLSILTGKNGAGKTSILKLLWYVVSGNIGLALIEVPFKSVTVETDLYICTVTRTIASACKIQLLIDGKSYLFEDSEEEDFPTEDAEDKAAPYLIEQGGSVFFPTFRRIEGGFSLIPAAQRARYSAVANPSRARNAVEDALVALSQRLTHPPHIFVAAISTADINALLLRQFADLSEESNSLQQVTSTEVIAQIKAHKSDYSERDNSESANSVLDEIRLRIEKMEADRIEIMAPLDAVRKLVQQIFQHAGISIGSRLSFGDAANAINSNSLSAGEKQMLSFICYNAFYKDCVFFIDEPELSLHVDWQRRLFSILQAQGTSNQFIVATHSPFIYGKYPDKEICIDEDRGELEHQG